MKKPPRQFHGFRLGALTLLSSQWYPLDGRRVTLASWHNLRHMCWLWFFEVRWIKKNGRDARRVGFFRLPGSQARYGLSLWVVDFQFVYQAEGWYRNPEEFRAVRGW